MKRGIFFTLLALAMFIAFICSLAPPEETKKPSISTTSTIMPQARQEFEDGTTTSSTRTPPIEISVPAACRENADCGIEHIASCHCDGDQLKTTRYIPLCVGGSCIWKSITDELFCKGKEYDSGDNSTGQRCVNGFGRCIKNSEYERFFVLPPNTTVINQTPGGGYSLEYRGYRFRYNDTGFYSPQSRCYENQYYIVDYLDRYGDAGQITVSWNRSAYVGNIVVKVGGARKDLNGTAELFLWARKAKKNYTGYF